MLDKECCTVHRCGTLVLGVFLEKDKLLPLSPCNNTLWHTHIHTLRHTCIGHRKGEKKCDTVRKVKICKWTRCPRINPVIHSWGNQLWACVSTLHTYITSCLLIHLFVLIRMSQSVNVGVQRGYMCAFKMPIWPSHYLTVTLLAERY